MRNTRVQRAAIAKRNEGIKNFLIITIGLVSLVAVLLWGANVALSKIDNAVCRDASLDVYRANHCAQDVTGVTR